VEMPPIGDNDKMTMADECDVSKIVTTFLLNTCRLPMRLTRRDVQAAVVCGMIASGRPEIDKEAEIIPFTTGSVAEFYIDPMLPHVGDIDVMYHHKIYLAIPRGHPPPTQLPAEFHNYVKVFEIIDSQLPGHVCLPLRYLLTQNVDDGKYNYVKYDQRRSFGNINMDDKEHSHGPAVFTDNSKTVGLSVDAVRCVRCLSWPPQAADWPTRHRNYDWPDSATLDCAVNNGCDVVGVAHRQCRQHEWLSKYQHRMSFSRAEIVLINSWMPVQQIAYHILRVYVKTERLTESVENSEPAIMSNYHIKTLMLWACELKPRSWWNDNLNLVRICAELLNTLSVWLSDTRCPHYFIDNCNLLDTSLSDAAVTSKLMSIDETYLSTWLINSYIRRCALLCPSHISRLFDDVSTGVNLANVVSETVRWRLDSSLLDVWETVRFAELTIPTQVSTNSVTGHSCGYWMKELTKIDQRFCLYFSAVALLHVACELSRNGFSDMSMKVLSTLLEPNFNQRYSVLSPCKTELNTSELVELLRKSAVEQLTTYRQLMAPDVASVVTIVTTDFEALYAYKRGDYQRCLELSSQNVHTLWYRSYQHSVNILNPEFVQLLDDDIVSLTALMLIVNPQCTNFGDYCYISQLTLSLYLMTQCQLKLHHSVTSLDQTLWYIKGAQIQQSDERTLDQLTLKLIERKACRTYFPRRRYSERVMISPSGCVNIHLTVCDD